MEESSSDKGATSLACRYCDRRFRRLEHVQRHERTHTKETPYQCPCGRSFSRRDLLRRHEQAVHHGQRLGRYERMAPSSESRPSVDLAPPRTRPSPGTSVPGRPSDHGDSSITLAASPVKRVRQSSTTTPGIASIGPIAPIAPFSASPTQPLGDLATDAHLHSTAPNAPALLHHQGAGLPATSASRAIQSEPDEPVDAGGNGSFMDFPARLDEFDAFLDMTDFSTFIPPNTGSDFFWNEGNGTFDLAQAASFQDPSQVPDNHDGHTLSRGENDPTISRFGSPLPSLPFESKESELKSMPGPSSPLQPCWKVSSAQYREIRAKIDAFADVLPKSFTLPSRHTISRYLEGCIKGLFPHLPLFHVPTFHMDDAAPELVLAMAAIGSLFRFEGHRGPVLFYAAKAVILEQVQRRQRGRADDVLSWSDADITIAPPSSMASYPVGRDRDGHHREILIQENGGRTTSVDPLLQTSQALVALLAMGAWGPQPLLREAITLQSIAATLARDDGFSGLKDPDPFEDHTSDWHSWVQRETRKRTKLMMFAILQLMSISYNVPPVILISEINCTLPVSAREWHAKTSDKWADVWRSSPSHDVSFQEAFESLFDPTAKQSDYFSLSPLGNYLLILAILQHLFLRRQTVGSFRAPGLGSDDIKDIGRALRCWQTRWERSPESNIDPSSAAGPVAFNSTALLRLAWIRLHNDLGPYRNLASRDASLIASAFNNSPVLVRGPELIHAVLQAAHALSVPVRMGIHFVAKTQTISWSVQHSFSDLECAIFLSKWLELVAVASATAELEKDELVLVQMIQSLLSETGLYDAETLRSIAGHPDQKQAIRRLATSVARLWAEIFRGTHVFEVVNIIGASLSLYAESMEKGFTPANIGTM